MKITIFELKKLIRNMLRENSTYSSEMNDDDSYEDIKKTHRLVKGEWPKMDVVQNPYEDIKKTHKWKDDDDMPDNETFKTYRNESINKKGKNKINESMIFFGAMMHAFAGYLNVDIDDLMRAKRILDDYKDDIRKTYRHLMRNDQKAADVIKKIMKYGSYDNALMSFIKEINDTNGK